MRRRDALSSRVSARDEQRQGREHEDMQALIDP
jgi:hypothetical protein